MSRLRIVPLQPRGQAIREDRHCRAAPGAEHGSCLASWEAWSQESWGTVDGRVGCVWSPQLPWAQGTRLLCVPLWGADNTVSVALWWGAQSGRQAEGARGVAKAQEPKETEDGSGGRKSSILHRLICDVGTGGQIDPWTRARQGEAPWAERGTQGGLASQWGWCGWLCRPGGHTEEEHDFRLCTLVKLLWKMSACLNYHKAQGSLSSSGRKFSRVHRVYWAWGGVEAQGAPSGFFHGALFKSWTVTAQDNHCCCHEL